MRSRALAPPPQAGSGCPTDPDSYQCCNNRDGAEVTPCGDSEGQSVVIPNFLGASFVAVAMAVSNDASGPFTLAWSYVPPGGSETSVESASVSPSASASASQSPSLSATVTASHSGTGSVVPPSVYVYAFSGVSALNSPPSPTRVLTSASLSAEVRNATTAMCAYIIAHYLSGVSPTPACWTVDVRIVLLDASDHDLTPLVSNFTFTPAVLSAAAKVRIQLNAVIDFSGVSHATRRRALQEASPLPHAAALMLQLLSVVSSDADALTAAFQVSFQAATGLDVGVTSVESATIIAAPGDPEWVRSFESPSPDAAPSQSNQARDIGLGVGISLGVLAVAAAAGGAVVVRRRQSAAGAKGGAGAWGEPPQPPTVPSKEGGGPAAAPSGEASSIIVVTGPSAGAGAGAPVSAVHGARPPDGEHEQGRAVELAAPNPLFAPTMVH